MYCHVKQSNNDGNTSKPPIRPALTLTAHTHAHTHQHAVVEVSIAAEAVEAVARDVIGAELVPHGTNGRAPHGVVAMVELTLLERQVEVAVDQRRRRVVLATRVVLSPADVDQSRVLAG